MWAPYIWKNGELCEWEKAQVHVLSHALHYGTSIFEGLRAYEIGENACVLRPREHFERMLFSCRVARAPSPLDVDQWIEATAATLRANEHRAAYIRPLVYRGLGETLGLDGRSGPIETIVATVPWATYFGADALERGIDAQVSSWRRPGAGAVSALAKIGGHYAEAQMVLAEAKDNGFAEGIMLDQMGHVTEGSGQNIFLVIGDELITPGLGDSILEGVTRNCIRTIAADLGITVREATTPRDLLYKADEIFFTGTAVEVCPVRSVDRIIVGEGRMGPVTRAIQQMFFGIVTGALPDKWGWLEPVCIEPLMQERRAV
ncbi:branched chain amino acid aminotransferase [Breoghania corrubedonensis]|uniref:Branched-chain-amino-acid aminotransferase n=1 Tax=Breoghania corrubedonensis TaxID=665038 RepID=A0A2T5VA51_9HYPH|nr:branched-chain amino acid transaminase [Breoghania corrubedonensis]PTW60633.1 branched chain amino acid aminotransferase [Breoghania corrubedonensis]